MVEHPGIAPSIPAWKVLADGHQRVSLNTYARLNSCPGLVKQHERGYGANANLFMSEEQNKAVVQNFIDAINRQDWRRFNQLVAPDFVRHSSTFGQSAIRTREELQRYLEEEFKTFPDALETVNFMVAEGDKVVVHSHCLATQRGALGPFPPMGRQLSADFISVYRVVDGQVVEAWVEWDCLNGLIQLGHMSPPS